MTTLRRHAPRLRLDVASLVLLLIGLVFGVISYWLIDAREVNVLVIVPSIVAVTVGAMNLMKRQAPRL